MKYQRKGMTISALSHMASVKGLSALGWGEVACKGWPYLQALRVLRLLSCPETSLNAPNRMSSQGRFCSRVGMSAAGQEKALPGSLMGLPVLCSVIGSGQLW